MTMNRHPLEALVSGIFAVTTLALAVSVGAQTTPPTPPSAATGPQATRMSGHDKHTAAGTGHVELNAECQSMMTKKQAMQDKLQAMDATLDKLVVEMNAAKGSKDALEKPMAAVLNELVAQRKASRSMMMEMQPQMMAHMMAHMGMHGTDGAMGCPMLKMGDASGSKPGATMPKM